MAALWTDMDGLPHDLAVLQTCLMSVQSVWRDSPPELREQWPALAAALDDLSACPDLVTLISVLR